MTTFDQIVLKIIKEQELIIGPIAWDEAERVDGIHIVNKNAGEINIDDAKKDEIINALVTQYEHFFGRAAREVCKEAASSLLADLPPSEIPSSLQ